jgi:hypothetical protein
MKMFSIVKYSIWRNLLQRGAEFIVLCGEYSVPGQKFPTTYFWEILQFIQTKIPTGLFFMAKSRRLQKSIFGNPP